MVNNFFLAGQMRIFIQLHKSYLKPYTDDAGISYDHIFYLYLIDENPGCNQNFFVELFKCRKSSISTTLRNLENKGLIIQNIDPDNRRSYNINLTPDGEKLLSTIKKVDEESMKDISNLFDLSDEFLDKYVKNIYDLFV